MKWVSAILLSTRLPVLFSVWSNALAGWWLGGAGDAKALLLLGCASGLAWVGAALLNDVIDADFDQEHHPTRSIPAGLILRQSAWFWSLAALSASVLVSFAGAGRLPGVLCLALVIVAVLTTAVHRFFPPWPVLAGACRLLVYLLAASMADKGITGIVIWSGLTMALYTTGVAYYQKWAAKPDSSRVGPTLLLLTPIGLALVVNSGPFLQAALLLGAVFGFWVAFAVYQGSVNARNKPTLAAVTAGRARWPSAPSLTARNNPTLAAAWLVPGIILADWLALGNPPGEVSILLLALFIAAVLAELVTPRPPPLAPRPSSHDLTLTRSSP